MNTLTVCIIIGTFIAWIAWDVYVSKHGGSTESQILQSWSIHSTWFPFLIGMLIGHWFIGQRVIIESAWMLGLIAWFPLIGWDIYWAAANKPRVWYRWAPIYVVLGAVMGALVWGQNDGGSPVSALPRTREWAVVRLLVTKQHDLSNPI